MERDEPGDERAHQSNDERHRFDGHARLAGYELADLEDAGPERHRHGHEEAEPRSGGTIEPDQAPCRDRDARATDAGNERERLGDPDAGGDGKRHVRDLPVTPAPP